MESPLFLRLRLSCFGLFRAFPVALYRVMRSWRGACWKTTPKCRQIDDIRRFVRAEEVILGYLERAVRDEFSVFPGRRVVLKSGAV